MAKRKPPIRTHARLGRGVEDGFALLAGAGAGILAMYLLDPSSGPARRRAIAARARERFASADEAVTPVVTAAAERVSGFGRRIAHTTGEYGADLVESGRSAVDAARETFAESAHPHLERLADLGRSIFVRRHRRAERSVAGPLGGLGMLALGAGISYFCDPNHGRARRRRVVDVTTGALADTGSLFRKAGRRIVDQLRGGIERDIDEPTDEALRARVRSRLRNVISNLSDVQVVAEDGFITISGEIPQSEIDSMINAIMYVRGVRGVTHQRGSLVTGA